LDGNKIHVVGDYTFAGIQLESLGLSRNEIKSLSACSFCNSSVKRLDISRNEIEAIDPATFKPLEYSLTSLHSEENQRLSNPSRSVYNMLRPLSNLRTLSLSSMTLDDTLPDTVFVSQAKSLRVLDLSGNNIVNVSSKWFDPTEALEELDISQNKIYRLTGELLKRFDQMSHLRAIYMHDNPWSCYRCFILPMLDWLSTSPPAYHNVCHRDEGFCVRCSSPADLSGRSLHDINEIQLEWCTDPTVQLRLATSEPRVGLVLAILIIIVIVAIIVTIVVIYRKKQGAVYYTHEDDRGMDRSIFSVDKSLERNKSIMANSLCSPPFSPAQNSSPCSLSPPLSPSTPFRSQSLCSIPPPPPLPPPELPFVRRSSSRAMETKAKIRLS
jgi:Leucine-rich repeat (LRR) protein